MPVADEGPSKPLPTKLPAEEAGLARTAQQALLAAPTSARGVSITFDDASLPAIQLPPQALPFIAEVLGVLGAGRNVVVSSMSQELSTFAAARYLNVSRPFVIKEIEAGRLKHRMVGSHRRIDFDELRAYEERMQAQCEAALQRMADQLDDLGIPY
jgi:excisionase family DNA binding protein